MLNQYGARHCGFRRLFVIAWIFVRTVDGLLILFGWIALPVPAISRTWRRTTAWPLPQHQKRPPRRLESLPSGQLRSEEHTSELQSRLHLVCRLLLEKKTNTPHPSVMNAS